MEIKRTKTNLILEFNNIEELLRFKEICKDFLNVIIKDCKHIYIIQENSFVFNALTNDKYYEFMLESQLNNMIKREFKNE